MRVPEVHRRVEGALEARDLSAGAAALSAMLLVEGRPAARIRGVEHDRCKHTPAREAKMALGHALVEDSDIFEAFAHAMRPKGALKRIGDDDELVTERVRVQRSQPSAAATARLDRATWW